MRSMPILTRSRSRGSRTGDAVDVSRTEHHLVLCLEVAVGVGDGQGNGVLDLGDQSQHQKLVLGGGDVIARYRGRLTRRAGTADIAGTVGVAGGGLTVCGGRLIAGDGVGRVIRVPLSGNGVAGRRDCGRQWIRGNPHDSMGKRLVNYVTYIMPQVLENTGRNAGRILKLGGSPSGPVL